MAMVETTLAHGPTAASGPLRHRVLVHVDSKTGEGHLHDGPNLSPETTAELSCDAEVFEITTNADGSLNLGRKSREPNYRQRMALLARDGGCVFPTCANRRYVDAHHIVHWEKGGPTDMDNLVLLCRRHHRAVHHRGCTGELRNNRARVRGPDGEIIESNTPPPSLRGPGVVEQNRRAGLTITPDTAAPGWDGYPVAYRMAVDGLVNLN